MFENLHNAKGMEEMYYYPNYKEASDKKCCRL